MLLEGYAAATSRRVAAKAGVRPALAHSYIPTVDDLFPAVFGRGAEANLERQRKALLSARPLRALWELSSDREGTALLLEFMALANHRKEIRSEIAVYAQPFREAQVTRPDVQPVRLWHRPRRRPAGPGFPAGRECVAHRGHGR
jgi:AcrR family transcriptional regulator